MSGPPHNFASAVRTLFVDILNPAYRERVARIADRLAAASEELGIESGYHVGFCQGAGHSPDRMEQGKSGTGALILIYSPELLTEFEKRGGAEE